MYANYHTHTSRCHHASGTIREYINEAIKNGIKILGFSDHIPYVFSKDYYSTFRMNVSETESYVNEIRALRDEYKDKIKIYIGYESEYYPKEFKATLYNIKQFECDYLILGQHFINNEYDGVYTYNPADEHTLVSYVDQVIEGIETGLFSYIAHPDLVFYRDNAEVYKKEMTRLCKAALANDTPLEFNLLGFKENREYPYNKFWEIVSKIGNDVIIGCDAHMPEDVGKKDIYERAVKELATHNITPLKELKLKPIK